MRIYVCHFFRGEEVILNEGRAQLKSRNQTAMFLGWPSYQHMPDQCQTPQICFLGGAVLEVTVYVI